MVISKTVGKVEENCLVGKTAKILRGKNKGRLCEVLHITKSHPLSMEVRYVVHLLSWKSFWDKRVLLINESGLQEVKDYVR